MRRKSKKSEVLLGTNQGEGVDARYLGYFECFNRQSFFEAHEVLEELWLAERGGPRELFYKGLIQLAGAFVHLQKNRPAPARALFRLAQSNLAQYPAVYERLELAQAQQLVSQWLRRLDADPEASGIFPSAQPPKLCLL